MKSELQDHAVNTSATAEGDPELQDHAANTSAAAKEEACNVAAKGLKNHHLSQ